MAFGERIRRPGLRREERRASAYTRFASATRRSRANASWLRDPLEAVQVVHHDPGRAPQPRVRQIGHPVHRFEPRAVAQVKAGYRIVRSAVRLGVDQIRRAQRQDQLLERRHVSGLVVQH